MDESAARAKAATRTPTVPVAGRYALGELLGAGGFSSVHAARDLVTGARVAVKLLVSGPHTTPLRVGREVAALRLLRLPGVVTLLDQGVHRGRPFLVMDLVEGRPFPGRGSATPWDELAPLALSLLEILARVHAAGVVHRDLKPSNVLVDATGQVTVVDFGVSRGPALGASITDPGAVVGTPEYLAPEQVVGHTSDARSDLYALGVMLYDALTGRLPHDATDVPQLLRLKRSVAAEPVRRHAPDTPRQVAQVIDRLLAIDAADRPQSAGEALLALFGDGVLPAATPPLPRLGRTTLLADVVSAAAAGRSVDVHGPRGSGRSRLLADAAADLAARGLRPVWTVSGSSPYESLAPVVGGLEDLDALGREDARAAVSDRVARALRSGAVLLADDAERLDPWSADVIESCRGAGPVIRAARGPTPGSSALESLEEADLRPLFAGPDRILHLREDGARELWRRTGGLPGRIVAELSAWVRSGLASWDGGPVSVPRASLDRLRGGMALGDDLPFLPAAGPCAPHLDQLLAWLTLAWPHATPDVLSAAAGQARWRVDAELDALAAEGLARRLPDGRVQPLAASHALPAWTAEQRRASHAALARALPRGTPLRLRHLAAAGEPHEVVEEARVLAPALVRDGRTGDALVVLEQGLAAAREDGDAAGETRLCVELTQAALTAASKAVLEGALYELSRAGGLPETNESLRSLLTGALDSLGPDPQRALGRLGDVSFADRPLLELFRHTYRLRAARNEPPETVARMLDEIEPWARACGLHAAQTSFSAWKAVQAYSSGRHAEAAQLHLQAATTAERVHGRASCHLNAGLAFLEAGDLVNAAAAGAELMRLATERRLPTYSAYAEWIVRQCRYRSGEVLVVDRELLDAVALLADPGLSALIELQEAAVAWRMGERGAALPLCDAAAESSRRAGAEKPAVLARALALSCGAPARRGEIARLVHRAMAAGEPAMAVEALALIATARPPSDAPRLRSLARPLRDRLAAGDVDARRIVLSMREADACLAGEFAVASSLTPPPPA